MLYYNHHYKCIYIYIYIYILCLCICTQGLIDPKKELEKLQKKKDHLIEVIQKLKQDLAIPDYDVKVPLDVQKNNKEKLANSEGELQRIIDAITILQTM